ncbi:MAG TPA: hypothetical protein VI299_12685, partial [Polyangiales bacterium]
MLTREQIATRVARELPHGASVSLDPTWASEIKAHLPTGVRVAESGDEADVAVVAVAKVAVDGGFAEPVPPAKRVIALVAQHQSDDGVSRVVKPELA